MYLLIRLMARLELLHVRPAVLSEQELAKLSVFAQFLIHHEWL